VDAAVIAGFVVQLVIEALRLLVLVSLLWLAAAWLSAAAGALVFYGADR
jgi:hypothetical protein